MICWKIISSQQTSQGIIIMSVRKINMIILQINHFCILIGERPSTVSKIKKIQIILMKIFMLLNCNKLTKCNLKFKYDVKLGNLLKKKISRLQEIKNKENCISLLMWLQMVSTKDWIFWIKIKSRISIRGFLYKQNKFRDKKFNKLKKLKTLISINL